MTAARDWVITYKSGRAPVVVWAVIVDVPGELGLEAVSAALETWARWPQWQARVRPGAVLAVRPRRASDAEQIDGEAYAVHRLEWAALAPERKKLCADVDGPTYAAIARAARLSGLSLQRWMVAHLTAAAGADLDAVDAGRPPAFLDEPLPGMVP